MGLYVPLRGSDVGVWDLPENANDSATDSLFTNLVTISLSNAPVTLTTPPNSGAAWAGPYQSQSALIRFTGMLTASCTVTFPRPGFFIVENLCTVGAFAVILASAAPGNVIGITPGKKMHVFNDGVNMDFVDLQDPSTPYDLHGATAMPAWMTACTVLPYLIKDGTIYNNSLYPALAAALGNQFGGTPGVSFAVPDEMARARIGYDTVGTGRLTTVGSGVNGQTMGSAGGNQAMQAHNHGVTDPGHVHGVTGGTEGGTTIQFITYGGGSAQDFPVPAAPITISRAFTGISINNAGAGASQNVQPSLVSFLPLIKT